MKSDADQSLPDLQSVFFLVSSSYHTAMLFILPLNFLSLSMFTSHVKGSKDMSHSMFYSHSKQKGCFLLR